MPEHQQTQQSTESKTTSQKQTIPRIHAPISHPMAIIQRARINPKSLTPADVLQLQQTIGNRAVGRLLSEIGLIPSKPKQAPPVQRQELVQCQEIPEEEEPLQGKFDSIQRQEISEEEETCPSCVQRQEKPEEEEPLQGKFETIQRREPEDEEKIQMKSVVQRQEISEEEDEPVQGKMIGIVQRKEIQEEPLQTKRENNTGMPDNLKAGVENLSGIDMSDVRVHYNSSKPAEVGALAYTQGTNIHVAPGQEKHLPHEAWHVVQQTQGRVQPTMQLKDVAVNDDSELEREADVMSGKVLKSKHDQDSLLGKCTMSFRRSSSSPLQMCLHNSKASICSVSKKTAGSVIQRIIGEDYTGIWAERRNANGERIYYQVFKYDSKSKNYILYHMSGQHTEVGYDDPNYFQSKGPVGLQYFESRSTAAATTSPPAPPLPRDPYKGLAVAPARPPSQVPSLAKDERVRERGRVEKGSIFSELEGIDFVDLVRSKGQGTVAQAVVDVYLEPSKPHLEAKSDILGNGQWLEDQPSYYQQFSKGHAGGDAEVKVLSDVTFKVSEAYDQVYNYQSGLTLRGKVILQISQGPCSSCRGVIKQFHTDHPGVLLIVRYRQDKAQMESTSSSVGGLLGYKDAEELQGLWVKKFEPTI